ncbi:aquaporin-like protein [Morchella conica CCBAS932]|uniref:Aquaporin-like protein n=1 Tax=Morchella conica CCBAS932 TaxID=1392247 RepID=A0A3N4KF39_9PEZI|nr:aquaporin-like protein [Morchella conica CCBAS932]
MCRIGTVLFLFFAFGGTQVASTTDVQHGTTSTTMSASDTSILLYIALSFGFSLAVNAWIFFRVSGGLFNPAVTLALVLVGTMSNRRGIYICISQIVGAIAASAIISALLPGRLSVETLLTEWAAGTSVVRGLFIEMFCTCLLVFTILMLAVEKHRATFIAPIGIGLALFISEMVAVFYTGGAINPARAFGPAVVVGSFPGYHWIYWVGPGLGAMLASSFYKLIKILEYESANPDQDAMERKKDEHEAKTGHRPSDASTLSPTLNAEGTSGGARGGEGAGLA